MLPFSLLVGPQHRFIIMNSVVTANKGVRRNLDSVESYFIRIEIVEKYTMC